MRFIDPVRINAAVTGDFLRQAKTLSEELDTATDEDERRAIIKDGDFWRDAKRLLKPIFNRKCWYCETSEDRSDNAIDHFRPKSLYDWLIFELSNFRFSCTFCNSRRSDPDTGLTGGKQDLFPLADGSPRATRADELDLERPLLLDPCKFEDHKRLWFDETGLASLRPRYEGDAYEEKKFEESRKLYNLDFFRLAAARRRKYFEVIELCREGDRYWTRFQEGGNEECLHEFSNRVVKLARLIDYTEEHSAAAWHATLGLRTSSVTARHALGIED